MKGAMTRPERLCCEARWDARDAARGFMQAIGVCRL